MRVKIRRSELALATGVWPLLAVLVSVQVLVFRTLAGEKTTWSSVIRYPVVEFAFWMFATPLTVWLSRRFPLTRQNWRSHTAALIAATTIVTVVHAAYRTPLHRLVYPNDWSGWTLASGFNAYLIGNFLSDTWVFWTTVIIVHTADYYRRDHEREQRLSEAQLHMLQMQMQPHFLFNTLNSISSLIRENPKAADRMIATLGSLLRKSLNGTRVHQTSVSEELNYVRSYLEIEKVRFEDRLEIIYDVGANVSDALVPYLILQPLVENAIRHGVGRSIERSVIAVGVKRADRTLELSVSDSGPGLPPEVVPGIGLSNTASRLELLYPGRHSFIVQNGLQGGVTVTITIPYRTSDDEPTKANGNSHTYSR